VTVFLLWAAILVAGALALVLPPALGIGARARAQANRQRQTETALNILREQLAELDADRAAGQISEGDHARAKTELEQRALDEGVHDEEKVDIRPAKHWAIALLLAVPLLSVAFYLVLGEPEGMDPAKIARGSAAPISASQVDKLVEKLEADPDDPTGWSMLAHSYVLIGNLEGAQQTWRRIGAKAPQDPDVLVNWADVLATAQKGDFSGEPDRLLAKALELDPYHVKGWMLMSAAAFQRKDTEAGAKAVASLAEAVGKHPQDAMGWIMLARSYVFLGDAAGALAVWQRIGAGMPDSTDAALEWAELLATAQQGDFSGEPDRLLAKVLTLEPDNPAALALSGISAFQRGDYAESSGYMERLLERIPREDPAYASVLENINEARQRAGMPAFEGAAVVPQQDAQPQQNSSATQLKLSGTVSLAAELAADVEPDQAVFLFVRPAEGGTPLAALRMTVADLPRGFNFSQAQLMQDGPPPEQVVVIARVSRSGDASAKLGDLEGSSGALAPDSEGVELVIDSVLE